ncbi:MAG: hypothetical protein Q4B70_16710, partial [Lachnospiraceae bacterium]|nr:hypothetical protein [Lachnospiraceae bacterium]
MMKRKLATVLFTLGMAFSMVLPAAADSDDVRPTSIKISGKSTVSVGSKLELDSVLGPKGADTDDDRIVWSSSKPSVAKVLEKRDDDTKIKGVKAGTATITVKIKGTKIKASKKITVKKKASTSSSTSSDTKKIAEYKKTAQNLKKTIQRTKAKSSAAERKSQYNKFENQIESLDNKLEKLEQKWKSN